MDSAVQGDGPFWVTGRIAGQQFRSGIEDRYAELLSACRCAHGRDPNRSTQLRLAQQATLQTREGKAPGRTLAEQIADWIAQAQEVVGRRGATRIRECVGRAVATDGLDDEWVDELAREVVVTASGQRSTSSRWNAFAEAERVLHSHRIASKRLRNATRPLSSSYAAPPATSSPSASHRPGRRWRN